MTFGVNQSQQIPLLSRMVNRVFTRHYLSASIADRIVKGTLLNFLATLFNQGSTLIANIAVARLLMREVFGEYAMVQNTLLTMATISQLATGYTALKYVAEFRSSDPDKAGRIVGLCALVSVIAAGVGGILLLCMSSWLSTVVLKSSHLTGPLMIGSVFIFFSAINGYQTGVLSGLEAYGTLAKTGMLSGVMTVCAVIFGAKFGALSGALAGLSTSAFLRCFMHHLAVRTVSKKHGIEVSYCGLSAEKSVITSFAIPVAFAGYYAMPMIWLGNSLLARQEGGYGEMAIYAAALNIKSILLFIPAVINNVMASILNNVRRTDGKRYDRLYGFNVGIIFFTTALLSLILSIFGEVVLGVFGRSFVAGKTVLFAVLLSGVFEATGSAIYQRIQNYGRMWLSFLCINVPLGPLFVIIAFLTVPRIGALGLSIASVIMTGLALLLTGIIANLIRRQAPTDADGEVF